MTQRAVLAESVAGLGLRAVWGPIADVIVFIAATAQGMPLANAHLAGFAVATILNYFLIVRSATMAAGRRSDWRLYVHLLVVSLFAVSLRGAVLGLLINVWGWPPQIAIVLAAIAAMAVALPGYALAVGTTKWTLGNGEHWRLVAMYLVAVAFLLRLLYITQVELLPEDSYYWNYAQHLDLSYLDHPPMVAWLIWLGTAVFGDSEFGVRISALCCAAVASFFAYRLTRNL